MIKKTENGAIAFEGLCSKVITLFGSIGASRNIDKDIIIDRIKEAYNESADLTRRMCLYARDIRCGGLGERKIGRIFIETMYKLDPNFILQNLNKLVLYGRWDDITELFVKTKDEKILEFIYKQLQNDIVSETPSLLAKWMPSENTSSNKTRAAAKTIRKSLEMSSKEYRKILSGIRKKLNLVETKLTNKSYDEIEYSSVPSVAMNMYKKTFIEKDGERFEEFISKVENGKETINAGVLFPYNITESLNRCYYGCYLTKDELRAIEQQWKALPDYVDFSEDVLVMADVSGSMTGRPMATSIGMALYFAERNTGVFKNQFITFTNIPRLFHLDPTLSLQDRYGLVSNEVGYNTNLDGALEAIVKSNGSPKALLVISDCEIDRFVGDGKRVQTIVAKYKSLFKAAGKTMPKIIFWNVEGGKSFLSLENENVAFTSGYSASIFTQLESLIKKGSIEAIIEILSKYNYNTEEDMPW